MVWDVVFPDIHNEIARLGKGCISSSLVSSWVVIKKIKVAVRAVSRQFRWPRLSQLSGHSRCDLGICVHGVHALLILLGNGHDISPRGHQILHIVKPQLQEGASIS